MDGSKVEARAYQGNSPSWADIIAETARPGASFSDLLSWSLDLAESSDQFSEWGYTQLLQAVAEHLAPLTGDEVGRLAEVLAHLFAVAHRRAPARPARSGSPRLTVRRSGRYRIATAFQPLRKAG